MSVQTSGDTKTPNSTCTSQRLFHILHVPDLILDTQAGNSDRDFSQSFLIISRYMLKTNHNSFSRILSNPLLTTTLPVHKTANETFRLLKIWYTFVGKVIYKNNINITVGGINQLFIYICLSLKMIIMQINSNFSHHATITVPLWVK